MLPKINKPTYTGTFPNSNIEFSYRPFTTDEQKTMLITAQAGKESDILRNMVLLVNACTFGKFDFMKETIANFEKVFLSIRSKSVSDVVEYGYVCKKHDSEGKECGQRNFVDVYFVDQTKFNNPDSGIIDIDSAIKVKLKPLTMADVIEDKGLEDYADLFNRIEWISSGDEFHTEFSIDEFKTWYEDIPPDAMNRILEYYENTPVAELIFPTKCVKCAHESEIKIKGSLNFFI